MFNSIIIQVCSLIYLLLLEIVYFSKRKINNLENKVYRYTLIINLVSVLLDICSIFTIHYYNGTIINTIVTKIYLISIILWITTLTIYIIIISKSNNIINKKNKRIMDFYVIFLVFFFSLMIFLLDLKYVNELGKIYSYGSAVNFVYFITIIYIILWVTIIFFNIKIIKLKKCIPIIVYVIFGALSAFAQQSNPEILLVSFSATLCTFIMYFTIENPDVKMVEQLNILKDQADRANNAKTEFLSSMSHEIRTPLNAINGFAQLIMEEDNIDVIKDEAKDIIMASDNLIEIVNGILDISKIEANKLEIVNVVYEPRKIFEELTKLTKARILEKPIEFKVYIAEDLPDYLNGDYVRLKQIVLNLLTNAAKYTKEGTIEFDVKSVRINNICRLIIMVKDTGIGIKKENIDKLFTRFERFDKEKNMTIEGTGLGLAITKKLIDLMGGKIAVNSIYGKGSSFAVSIDQTIINKKKEVKEEKIEKEINFKGKRVLIVDDNNINLKVADRLLKTYKVDTELVNNGFDCLKLIDEGKTYDLILMDDMMPKMSGVETFKKLKEKEDFNIPVVALTANAIAGMKEKYLADGFNDYISKPIDKKELERVLKEFIK